MATDLFRKHCGPEVVAAAELKGWCPELWSELEESGLARVGVEGAFSEAAAVVRVAARFAAPVPLAETVLASWLQDDAPQGPLSVAYAGRASYGRVARWILVDGSMVGASHLRLKDGVNLAGEPLDSVDPPGGGEDVLLKGALIRSIQMAGALERILELTINYTRERHQFGRSLMRFQAVQQALALMAGEVAAAGATVDAAVETPDAQRVAIAKIRTGLAAGQASAIAHQLHGAIGLSQEHQLHHFTRRLWSWRDDFGTEHDWATRLGQQLLSSGQLWAALT